MNVIYNASTGSLIGELLAPDHLIINMLPEGAAFLVTNEVIDWDKSYVLDSIVVPRPQSLVTLDKVSLLADGIDIIAITSPALGSFKIYRDIPSKERFNLLSEGSFDLLEGLIEGVEEFSTTVTGTYKVEIKSFPYLDFIATIEAT
jgi:hypothetical protein